MTLPSSCVTLLRLDSSISSQDRCRRRRRCCSRSQSSRSPPCCCRRPRRQRLEGPKPVLPLLLRSPTHAELYSLPPRRQRGQDRWSETSLRDRKRMRKSRRWKKEEEGGERKKRRAKNEKKTRLLLLSRSNRKASTLSVTHTPRAQPFSPTRGPSREAGGRGLKRPRGWTRGEQARGGVKQENQKEKKEKE